MAATPPPSYTPAPEPHPVRNQRATFSSRVDAFITWFVSAIAEVAALASNAYANAVDAFNSATTATTKAGEASASAASAASLAGAEMWNAATNYVTGASAISAVDYQTYRRKYPGGVAATDPSADSANWTKVGGGGIAQIAESATSITLTSTPTLARMNATSFGAFFKLPDAITCTEGGPVHILENASTIPARVLNSAGTLIGFMPGRKTGVVSLVDNATAAGVWSITNMEPVGASAQLVSANLFNSPQIVDLGGGHELVIGSNASNHLYGSVYDKATNQFSTPTLIRAASIGSTFGAALVSAGKVLVVSCPSGSTALEAVHVNIAAGAISSVGTAGTAALASALSSFAVGSVVVQAQGADFVTSYYMSGTGTREIRAISSAGATPVISNAAGLATVNGGYVRTIGNIALSVCSENGAVYVRSHTINGSNAPAFNNTASLTAVTGTVHRFVKLASGRIALVYTDGTAVKGTIVSLSGSSAAMSAAATIFNTDSFNDSIAVGNDKLFVTGSANSSPCYNILTDNAGTAQAGTAIDVEAMQLTRCCVYADGNNVGVYAYGGDRYWTATFDCSGASPVISTTSGQVNIPTTMVNAFGTSTQVGRRSGVGVYSGAAAYRVAAGAGGFNPQLVGGQVSLTPFNFSFGSSAFVGADDRSSWIVNGKNAITKVECAA